MNGVARYANKTIVLLAHSKAPTKALEPSAYKLSYINGYIIRMPAARSRPPARPPPHTSMRKSLCAAGRTQWWGLCAGSSEKSDKAEWITTRRPYVCVPKVSQIACMTLWCGYTKGAIHLDKGNPCVSPALTNTSSLSRSLSRAPKCYLVSCMRASERARRALTNIRAISRQ